MLSKIIPDSWLLFMLQCVAHVALALQIFYGHWYHWLLTFGVYFLTGCLGMTMTYHRLLSHDSWKAPRWFHVIGTVLGCYGLTGSSIAWTAIHREHHHHTDDEADPHSPKHKGFATVQWLSMFEKPNPRYAMHLIRDNLHLMLHKYYFVGHLLILTLLLSYDPWIAIAGYLTPAAILWNAGSFINTVTHMFGYRNHATTDDSSNVWWLGYLVWGEGWHNNHHHRPKSPNFKEKWWEWDPAYSLIRLIESKPR